MKIENQVEMAELLTNQGIPSGLIDFLLSHRQISSSSFRFQHITKNPVENKKIQNHIWLYLDI